MSTDLDHEFLLSHDFNWDLPIEPSAQHAVARYGSDEDRLRLIAHDSVTADTLDALSQVPTAEVRSAVAMHPGTPLEALVRLTRDNARSVKAAASTALAALPAERRLLARSLTDSPMQRLRARTQRPRTVA
jgi:hypothetical protein